MSPDKPREKRGLFTTWQWAVLGAYVIAIVLSLVVGRVANKAVRNTERLDGAICAEIHYLEGVITVSENQAAANQLSGLVIELRKLSPNCANAGL